MTHGVSRRPRLIHCEDLIGARVLDASGERLGRVVDLEIRPQEDFRVAALIVGRFSFLDRFDFVRHLTPRTQVPKREMVVPWERVVAFTTAGIRLGSDEQRATMDGTRG